MNHWGVDSVSPVDSRVGSRTLFDYVVTECNRVPEFWGRYIGFSPTQIRPNELEFLHRKCRERGAPDCKIAVVYNGIRQRSIPAARGERGRAVGRAHGERAVSLAASLRIPPSVRIYCDLEGWRASPEFIQGWWDALHESPYVGMGGLYGRGAECTLSQAHDPLQIQPLLSRRSAERRFPSGVWSESSSRAVLGQDAALERLMSQTPGASGPEGNLSRHTWTNIPRGPRNPQETQFRGVGPGGGQVTTVWQYCMDYLRTGGAGTGRIDMDLATEVGYQEMWSLSGR